MKIFFIIVFLFITKSSLSQSNCLQIKGYEDEPVPYASVFVKKMNRTFIADSAGNICSKALQAIEKGDTILISAIGYHESRSVYLDESTVQLQKRDIVLPEAIIVEGKGKIEEWGTKKNPNILGGYDCTLGFIGILNSTARIIYPEGNYKKAEIISVSFYDRTGKEMNVPVRIRVYLISNDSLPYADYLTDNVIVNTQGKGWLTVNLENKGLIFPKEGLAFSIELFARDEEYYYYSTWKNDGKKYTVKRYGVSVGMESAKTFMTLIKLDAWNPWIIHKSNINRCGNLVCRVKVRVWR